MKNVLFMDDDQINDMKDQISDEQDSGEIDNDEEEEQEAPQQEPQGQKHSLDINVNNGD